MLWHFLAISSTSGKMTQKVVVGRDEPTAPMYHHQSMVCYKNKHLHKLYSDSCLHGLLNYKVTESTDPPRLTWERLISPRLCDGSAATHNSYKFISIVENTYLPLNSTNTNRITTLPLVLHPRPTSTALHTFTPPPQQL